MSAASHPRRRPARPSDDSMTLIDSFTKMSLRKGDTFHPSTSNKTELWDPLESKSDSPSMPARSTTCPKSLEDLLIGAGERRAAELLARVDKAIATNSKLALEHVLNEPEVLPVPTFVVDETDVSEAKTPSRLRHRNSHSSDSGIGSSVAESTESISAKTCEETDSDSTLTAGERSLSGISAATEERGLSKYAEEQVHKHIVKPILREQSLKEFHPLIKDVPRRIGDKQIKTLRDLEKTLIFLAPDYSRSPYKYLQFCERTIRVLHTTVTTLHESDQKAPADRPYTQGYFLDLVEQIRRYATILAATRAKQAKGEKLDEMDVTPDESVSVLGGMTHNGKPAELVRHKDGKTISIATGEVVAAEDVASSNMKRPSDSLLEVDEDDVLRSMARRKKNAKPEIHECPLCDKEFKRPCDLTKHVKTHERPWKCTDATCKYHEHGWPTEKERDRHVNDKHSNAPSLYHCLFKPCPYNSKRESNCKQHMEKAHGWEYVRSKSNGKGKSNSITRLPRGSIPPSPASVMLTPLTPIAPSPSTKSWSTASSRHDSMPPPGVAGPSNYGTPSFAQPSPDFAGHFNMNFDFNNMEAFPTSAFPMTPALSEDRRDSSVASSHSGLQLDGSSFDDAISPHELNFDNFSFGNLNFQQATPESSASSAQMSNNLPMDGNFGARAAHTSPGGHLDQTFTSGQYYDAMNVDDAYAPNEDFTLFGGGAQATAGGEMFPSLNEGSWGNFGKQFEHPQAPQLSTGNSALDELFPELKGH